MITKINQNIHRLWYRLSGRKEIITPLARRRLYNFRKNKRAFISFWIFLLLFTLSLFSEWIANEKPLVIYYEGRLNFPVLFSYPETDFGGEFDTEADYRDPYVQDLIREKGWMVWPLIRFSFDTINYSLPGPAPYPPTAENWLGTDDQGRDILAQLLYGLRTSLFFGILLTVFSPLIGVSLGALQGYFGGWLDLGLQRLLEIYASIPTLYVLIIIASITSPDFWVLLIVFLFFGWTSFVGLARAEFLRARNFDYVRAARALGVGHRRVIFKHILPNALASTLSYVPFIMNGTIASLASLDFLGLGLPPGSPSLGRLIAQGKNNINSPWIGIVIFVFLAFLFTILVFIGEGLRDALDPRKVSGE